MFRSLASRPFLACLIVLLACPAALAQQPKRGGVIRIAEREAPGLDPHLSVSFLTHSWASLVYSQLVRFPNGPEQQQYISHPPYVKGFKPHDGYGLGMRLVFTWLDK